MSKGIFSAVALCLLLAACTSVTESSEYLSLQSDLQTATADLESSEATLDARDTELVVANDALTAVEEDLASVQAELAEAEESIDGLEENLAEAQDLLDLASADFEGQGGEPYPEAVRAGFIDGCSEDADLEECTCLVEFLEQELSLEQFLDVSLAIAAGEDSEGLAVFLEAAFECSL